MKITGTNRIAGLVVLSLAVACSSRNALKPGEQKDGSPPETADPGLRDARPPEVTRDAITSPADSATSREDASAAITDTMRGGEVASPPGKPIPDARGFDTSLAREVGQADVARIDATTNNEKLDASVVDATKLDTTPRDLGGPDLPRDLGSMDAGLTTVAGLQVYLHKDLAAATDSKCVEGTASWIAALKTYAADDRKCWDDTDCRYVSFGNSCGDVCAVPMNVQRIGEFGSNAMGKLEDGCLSCPRSGGVPPCPPPPGNGDSVCRNGLCDWK